MTPQDAPAGPRVGVPDVHPDAVALTAFRELPDGRGRQYTISEAPSGRRAVVASIHRAKAIGFVVGPVDHGYALLDVLDANDDVIQTYDIPNARAWRWWYRHLHMRVSYTDGDPEPAP